MPEVSKFYGITIYMNFIDSEHNPPHIHAKYNGKDLVVILKNMKVVNDKNFPQRATKLVITWAYQHREELLEMWNSQVFKKVEPLE